MDRRSETARILAQFRRWLTRAIIRSTIRTKEIDIMFRMVLLTFCATVFTVYAPTVSDATHSMVPYALPIIGWISVVSVLVFEFAQQEG